MERIVIEMPKWLRLAISMVALGIMVILGCSIRSGHVLKKEITYSKGHLRRIEICDSSFQEINAHLGIHL